MSNLSIVLCATLFTSGVNAFFWPHPLKIVQDNTLQVINTLINEVKEKSDAVLNEAKGLLEKVMVTEDELVKNIGHVKNRRLEVKTGNIAKARDVTFHECDEWSNSLNNSAYASISDMTSCFTDKVRIGLESVEKIITTPIKVISNLTDIAREVQHCGDNVQDIANLPEAIVCVGMAAVKAAWVSTVGIPQMVMHISELLTLLATLQPELITCHATRGVQAFFKTSPVIIQGAADCFRQRIRELQKERSALRVKK